ncbi:uncharacterized protein LOC113234479 [Hyposmocoma kahamanoa]|uniref:uncharacterized protein LOC113234479 n=1 Tax=Hyposmocoma kahamanoa TaxID=1477025 RepID=UPI000E6D633D|nr:uncharacterized protein LOC113234479 [Hyposmocoma kahamanoa]
MFQYEYEKRPPSANSCDSRATMTTDWSRSYPRPYQQRPPSIEHARRPLPPRPIVVEQMPTKTTVPLKVWIIASASCFAVCAALVLATVVITKWGATDYTREIYAPQPDPVYSIPYQQEKQKATTEAEITMSSEELENEVQFPILEKLSIFKNIVANREKKRNEKKNENLSTKSQIHPIHDAHHIDYGERRIEKKDQAKFHEEVVETKEHLYTDPKDELDLKPNDQDGSNIKEIKFDNEIDFKAFKHSTKINTDENEAIRININNNNKKPIPDFKPTLPEVIINKQSIKLVDTRNYIAPQIDYEEYYNDQNLYDDYLESNSMTSYLIEKIQELHDWIVTDPDFEHINGTKPKSTGIEFGQVLKALNDSLIEGNVTIIMNKLRDIYFGENYTLANHTRKVILSNSTDLLSFGILTLDVMLLHNIQLMAWENQETARYKMLKDPDVFAFNALFMEPSKVEAKQNEVHQQHDNAFSKRQNLRDTIEDFDISKSLLENVLEIGMSTARAAIHLGRAYKNTKVILNQLSNSNRETLNANIQTQISRNIDANTHALHRLQTSFNSTANITGYTELDCVWLLYCRNLVMTAKLNPPYGTMARINGMALRMLTGDLSADRALDTMLYEVLTGWTDLRCNDMFPRCSKANAASVVMDSILAPLRKSQSTRTL